MATPSTKKSPSFEHNLHKLEDLVDKLEEDLPLEKAIASYEKGIQLMQACEGQLTQLKSRIEILTQKKK
jgi:exodeoxyribonuclease VII small subunit